MSTAPTTAQLVLLRHGETAWSITGQHTGRSDIPLTADGERQAVRAGAALERRRLARGRPFAVVHSSPLVRARRTAELAGFPDAVADPDLAEWDYGPVDGLTSAQVAAETGSGWEIFRDGVGVLPPRDGNPGETLDDVARRTADVLARVAPVLQDGGDVLLVAHGHVLRVLATVWLGLPPETGARLELGTAAIGVLGFAGDLRTLEGWNLPPEA